MPSDYKAISEHNEDQLGKDTSSRKTQVSMYSDSTHFVYEILQNADDHGATEVLFKLSKDAVMIEHNGEPFKEENVKAITYFGKSTSREDLVKTGRFGIGFKSVFAFTATPIIISRPEHFQIYGLYRVREYPYPEDFSSSRTRIILSFNHESEDPDFVEELVSAEAAYRQISECLTKLDMNTLLFMRNIREISWEIENRSMRYWREDEIDDNNRLTILTNGVLEKKYLVFSKVPTWENEEHKAVEIAFAINEQHHITSIDDDLLYVIFQTTENTGLRFLLNGPYRTNPARETISKKDPFNIHLMKVTCELMKELLPKIRKRKLLNLQFLSVLPNKEDEPRGFYSPLHDTIINEFRNEKLTPTKRKGHFAPALDLYQGSSELSELIRDADLAILLGKDPLLSLWVAIPEQIRGRDEKGRFIEDENARKQNKRINDFLDTLDIPKWTDEDLIDVLMSNTESVVEWLKQKSDKWHQNFYAYLEDSSFSYYYKPKLRILRIVRCVDGIYRLGGECHFSEDDLQPSEDLFTVSTEVDNEGQTESHEEENDEENFFYVSNAVYSSGNNKNQQKSARKFLETIGVTEVNETERVKVILKQRYSRDSIKLQDEDMKRFIDLVNEKPETKSIFKDYYIFEIDLQRDNKRLFRKPSGVFVDSPYLNTGLTAYFKTIDEDSDSFKRVLSPNYVKPESGIDPEDIGRFAEVVGAQTKLEVNKQPIPSEHPESDYLYSAPGDKESHYRINEDFLIPEFSILLNNPSIDKSQLIWRTMSHIRESNLKSQYRKSAHYESRYGDSSLVHQLRKAKWVPQKEDDSISFVCPCNASIDYLPEGFPYETGQEWLKVIEFGKKTKEHQEEHNQRNQQAKNFGFNSSEKAEKYAKLDQILEEHGMSPDDLISQYSSRSSETNPDFPTAPVKNPEFRKERVTEQIRNAPEKAYEERIRNERPSKSDIDQRTSLKEWYTNESGEMVCQICRKVMPFKKTDGEYYFVAIEALTIRFMNDQLPENHFLKELEAQYLALCPECAARYDYFVRAVKDGVTVMEELRNHLINSEDMEFPLKLGELDTSIRFVEAHFKDLKAALHYYENLYENLDDAEDSTD